jgi:hypothetical protein
LLAEAAGFRLAVGDVGLAADPVPLPAANSAPIAGPLVLDGVAVARIPVGNLLP